MENEELEKHLISDFIISKDIWKLFSDAYGYDNAASINWLIKKLLILYKRVLKGDMISVDNKDFILNKNTFQKIIEKEFCNISMSDIEELMPK